MQYIKSPRVWNNAETFLRKHRKNYQKETKSSLSLSTGIEVFSLTGIQDYGEKIRDYEEKTMRHRILYDDGDLEALCLSKERKEILFVLFSSY